jgi:hypothetical protein
MGQIKKMIIWLTNLGQLYQAPTFAQPLEVELCFDYILLHMD